MRSSNPSDFRHDSFQGWIGIARTDITPPIGIYARNWGAAKHDLAETIHCPLTLTALTLSSSTDGPVQVFVDADLGWWKSPLIAERFLKRLQDALSLNPANLIFALTHTHSGPPLMETNRSLPGGELLQSWFETFFESAVETIRQAKQAQFEAILDWDQGRCGLATIRDLPDPQSR